MSEMQNQQHHLEHLARRIRSRVLHMTHRARSSHIGSCFSIVDILTVLYSGILRFQSNNPQWPERDRFVLSKGHACAALYAILAESGFFPPEWLDSFYLDGSRLAGHVTHTGVPGVEASTGALGHGLSIACGMALAAKRDQSSIRVFALLSDGECDEGSTWEAALFAAHHGLDNLITIVDYNKIQSLGSVAEVLKLDPLGDKWRAFGWSAKEINGHDFVEIGEAFSGLPLQPGKPTCIVAHTVKGKGVSFMENRLLWHYRSPNEEELRMALAEIEVR